ncbi:Hypothetical protein A7982_11692 [Minicystis rosea]|nr:Hypothetical protein A7982_11692 [Minicystis rosea]
MGIELLLAHADDHRPVLSEGLPLGAASSSPRTEGERLPEHLRYDSADPNLLPAQRWGVIAPEGPLGDRLLGAIEPLRRARREDQGGAEIHVYRVPPGMDAASAMRWRDEVYWDEAVPEEELPRYLLVLGDADVVSWELQQLLASDTFVGRLAFSGEQGYEAYVDKLLRWERGAAAPGARALFHTVRDGTAATTIGHQALMAPSVALAEERHGKGAFPAKEIVDIGSDEGISSAALLEQAARPEPSMLFSISHGLGAPRRGYRSFDEQRALQGAMSLGGGQRLSAEHVAKGAFLPGGVWFFLACYGAGTPATSAYHHWLSRLQRAGKYAGRVDAVLSGIPKEGDRPFVAALPQSALSNPDGPLAVMGHVDLAWTYSFQDLGATTRNRPSRFQGIFRSLVDGNRVGVAHRELSRFFSETSVELSTMYDEEARREQRGAPIPDDDATLAKKANLWMLRQDLSAYVVLGDPAARLPIAPARAITAAPSVSAASVLGFAPAPAPAAARDVNGMVEAVIALLAGNEPPNAIAARAGVTRAELSRWAQVYDEAGRAALAKLA